MMQTVKCVVVGDNVADTVRLLISYTTGRYDEEYRPTMFADQAVMTTINGEPYSLGLIHIFSNMDDRWRSLYYPQTDVFVVCFSLVHPQSFENVRELWAPEVKHYCPNAPIILVGTKLEKRENKAKVEKLQKRGLKPTTYVEGLQLQRKIGAVKYHECSAKTLEGVREVFNDAACAAVLPFFKGKACPISFETTYQAQQA